MLLPPGFATRSFCDVPLRSQRGAVAGSLRVSRTSKTPAAGLIERVSSAAGEEVEQEVVQLLESCSYRITVLLLEGQEVDRIGPDELLDVDLGEPTRATLSVREHVGRLPIHVFTQAGHDFVASVEVRSKKLDYLTDYQRMLSDITTAAVGLASQRFAPVTLPLALDPKTSIDTLYLRFEVMRSLLMAHDVQAAFRQILTRPHVTWEHRAKRRRPDRGIRAQGAIVQQLARGHCRTPLPSAIGNLNSVPTQLRTSERVTTFDNQANRFVRFALERWRALAEDLLHAIGKEARKKSVASPVRRGQRIAGQVLDQLERYLSAPTLRDVRRLSSAPNGNQVLQKKPGYRRVLQMFNQVELGVRMRWDAGETLVQAGRRDVAALYEYWVYIKFVQLLGTLGKTQLDLRGLLTTDGNNLVMKIRRDQEAVVSAQLERGGCLFSLRLYFNRTFSAKRNETWTRNMRPDCALEIVRENTIFGANSTRQSTWLLFDAKYKVTAVRELMASAASDDSAKPKALTKATYTDIQTMHAYRDAIRRTVGSYVVFPGDKEEKIPRYEELLPGLGAFPMCPGAGGSADGMESVRSFVESVLEFLADDQTNDARSEFWRWDTYADHLEPPGLATQDGGATLSPRISMLHRVPLQKPPRDTRVTIGYVRGENWDWVMREARYVMRADPGRRGAQVLNADTLRPDLVLLYALDVPSMTVSRAAVAKATGGVELLTKEDLVSAGYRSAGGLHYIAVRLGDQVLWPTGGSAPDLTCIVRVLKGMNLLSDDSEDRQSERAAPQATDWGTILEKATS